MISPEEREVLKPVLGTSYSEDVLHVLKDKGVNSKKGSPFSPAFIVNVFNGVYENLHIESAILEVYQNRIGEKKKLEWQKDQLLNPNQVA